MKYLMITEPDDTHAFFVKAALEASGHEVRLFFPADLPTRLKNTVYIDDKQYQWRSMDKYSVSMENDYDVVWSRRQRKPFIPKEDIHPDDLQFVARENNLFNDSILHSLAPEAWWVNTREATQRANSKLLQLKIARECGMSIPITLCSNDPIEIKAFLLKHDVDGTVYKPLCTAFWFEPDQMKIAYTNKIKFLELPDNQVLQTTPGIFQVEIKKKYELRVTCFGDYLVAAKLYSQEHEKGLVDWRTIPEGQMRVEPYILPAELQNQIRLFMQKLGIVFGSMDFIVNEDGEYFFLEVNEQGQFLWIEEYNPAIPMLDIYVNFMINKTVDYRSLSDNPVHTLNRYRKEVGVMLKEKLRRHVNLNVFEYTKAS